MRPGNFTLIASLLVLTLGLSPVLAGEVLEGVKSRGVLRCGVSEGIPGFSQRDADGRWRGLDADFCRAVAAAVLGDGEKVEFVPLSASARFPALQARRIDLLARNTTWTLTREAVMKVQFPAILFYDGQAFMVPAASADPTGHGSRRRDGLRREGHDQPAQSPTLTSRARGSSVKPLVIDSAKEAAEAFFAGRCQAYTSDAAQLAAVRLLAPAGRLAYRILPERISREPLAPAVWGGDQQWATMVRWVLYALILAEAQGITRDQANDPPRGLLRLPAALGRAGGGRPGQGHGRARGLGAARRGQPSATTARSSSATSGPAARSASSAVSTGSGPEGGLMYAPPFN